MHRFFEWNKNKNAKKYHLCQKAEIIKILEMKKKKNRIPEQISQRRRVEAKIL